MKKILLQSDYKVYKCLLNPEDTFELDSLKFDVEFPVGLFEYSNVYVNDLGRVYDANGPIWDHEECTTIMRYCKEMSSFRRIREYYRNLLPSIPVNNLANKPFLLAFDIRIIGNYFHFIVDFVGRLMALSDFRDYIILLPEQILDKRYDYIQQVISMLGIECFFIKKNSSIRFKTLYAVSPVISSPGNQRKDSIAALRKFFLHEKSPLKEGLNKSVYISRNNCLRRINNENLFIEILRDYDVDVIYPEDVNFKDMINLMGNYNHLIGVDGAQLTNMLFMQNSSKICSLKHTNGNSTLPSAWFGKYPNTIGNHYFFSMANNLNFKFYNLYCDGDNSALEWANQNLIIPKNIRSQLNIFFGY